MATDRDHQDDQKKGEEQPDRDINQEQHDQDQKITGNPERLRDRAHRMDKRTNDVQGAVDYGENRHQPNEEPDHQSESRWTDIENDYRKRYPKLTDDDLHYRSGEFKHMTDRIAKRTNRTPEEVTKEIRDWDRKHKNS